MNPVARHVIGFSVLGLAAVVGGSARGDTQIWNDAGADNTWSTNAANWDAGSTWTNGNSAVFAGAGGTQTGEVVDVSSGVSLANATFQTNGYAIVDANGDGSLTLVGAPSVVSVVNAGDSALIGLPVAGSGGLTKTGNGVLNLTTNNSYTGTTTVSAGTLRLARNQPYALGQVGTGNDTVVAPGATLDFNGAYVSSCPGEKFTISGSGTDGKGVLVNSGAGHVNVSLGAVTMLNDSVIGGASRIDTSTIYMNGHTLTKTGNGQLCVQNVSTGTIVIASGQYTLLGNNQGLGGATPGDTYVYGTANLDSWNSMTVSERIFFNGGYVTQGNPNNQLFTLAGYMTLNSNVTFSTSSPTSGVEVAGYMDGVSGFTQANAGWLFVTCDTNAYSGPTTVNGGRSLWVGKTNLYAGVLGLGTVTNNGTLYAYSSRICQGNLANAGSLYLCTGLVSVAGSVLNSGNLYINRGGTFTLSNNFDGASGIIYVRSNANVSVGGTLSTNGQLRIGYGSFSLTNGALFRFTGEIQLADRLNLGYAIDPTNVTGVINVPAGCTLYAQAITFGNGTNVVNGGMTGILNQAGTVITTGTTAEENGIRLGHYPQTVSTYNMKGGTLTVGANYDLGCATDGNGWFNMTGGEVFTKRVMLNERGGNGGYGRLTVSGGTLNVGSLTGSTLALSNSIVADPDAPYLAEFGGAGGTIRAVTNITVFASNTVYGAGSTAITYDTTNWTITISGNVTGTGGVNKVGSGDLVLSGTNTYGGPTCIYAGTVSPAAGSALSTNSVIAFGVTSDGAAGVLRLPDGFSLAKYSVGAANPALLDKKRSYTVVSWSGSLAAPFGTSVLPGAWYVYYDWSSKTAQLRAAVGTVIKLR